MSLWDNKFWAVIEQWKKGVAIVFLTALCVLAGGLITLLLFALLILLPAELLFDTAHLENYCNDVLILASATYGVYLVAEMQATFR